MTGRHMALLVSGMTLALVGNASASAIDESNPVCATCESTWDSHHFLDDCCEPSDTCYKGTLFHTEWSGNKCFNEHDHCVAN